MTKIIQFQAIAHPVDDDRIDIFALDDTGKLWTAFTDSPSGKVGWDEMPMPEQTIKPWWRKLWFK